MPASDLESWKNPTPGRVWINRLDHRGELDKVEIVGPGRTFHLSSQERKVNQEMAYNDDLDIFANGTLTPVRLIDGDEDAKEFASNPNLMTEPDMRSLFKKTGAKSTTGDAFVERVGAIKNPATLERLLALAREEDAPLSRVEAIQERLTAVTTISGPETEQPGGLIGPREKRSTAVTPN